MSLLSEQELQQVAKWNATEQEYPRELCVPQLVARYATEHPGAVALVAGEWVIRYGELNQRANQLAHYLQGLGAGPDVRVALCVERSPDLIIGLLGILKAGATYLPLDPYYPAERLAFLVADAQAPILVTQEHLIPQLPVQGTHVIALDTDGALLASQRQDDPAFRANIDDLAYIIYTSGSTGQPKGVQITHNSLLNLVFWHQRAFAVTADDRATQLTSPAFDATGWEIWPYLTAGASIYLASESARVEPALLRDWLVEQAITISFVPTALVESLMTLEWPAETRLRYLLTGADALHHYPPASLPFKLVNNYGPTEATVLVTSGVVPVANGQQEAPSIGRVIANTQLYILDEQLRQVAIGEVGELYIGGTGLARGYLNQPEQTNEKFVPHPFSTEVGARLYKTGDLVRYLPDGQIAFIGRADYQIKIRGYRIEPGEIVAALNRNQSIQASCVIAREDTPGDKRLVAYLVLKKSAQVTASELREFLLETLPDYMVPAAFVLLESLPTTANGKVDRRALPAPDSENTLQDQIVSAPTTAVEVRLASIVSSLLGLEEIDIDDNFFLLGGHSLLGTQVIARISDTFGVTLPLRALFEAPTVRELSAEVEQRVLERIESMSDEEARLLLG